MRTESDRLTASAALLLALTPMLTALLVLGSVRLLFIAKFCPLDVFVAHSNALPLFALNTLRYDAHIGAYAALPILLFALAAAATRGKLDRPFLATLKVYTVVEAAVLALVGLCDVHWYNNFARHYDPTLFTVGDEEPLVLLQGVLSEAPWLMLTLGLAAAIALSFYGVKSVTNWAAQLTTLPSPWIVGAAVVAIVGVAMRGSLGVFTIRREDSYVSNSQLLNDCVVNGPYALLTAYKDHKRQFNYPSDYDVLKRAGFNSEREAAAVWLGSDSLDATRLNADSVFLRRTTARPRCPAMNVVVIVCESLGDKLLDYERRYGLDLLGPLRRHLTPDSTHNVLLWRHHFLSAANGTIQAVENFSTGGCPYEHLFASPARFVKMPLAPARVFDNAGYQTHFVSGIEISWYNCQECLRRQGFNSVVGKMEILAKHPDAECNQAWGVADHAMLDFLFEQLADNADNADGDKKPKYFLALTSTNHTPFELPDDIPLPPLELPTYKHAFAIDDPDVLRKYLRGYQYTCASLARFLDRLEASPCAQNTIVAITGDHNTRYVLPYADGERAPRYAIPLILRLPATIAVDSAKVCHRAGSQLDINITLANLTLASQPLLWLGQDLLADTLPNGSFARNVECTLPGAEADSATICRRVNAREALRLLYFKRLLEPQNSK